jgi:hypothetical protein
MLRLLHLSLFQALYSRSWEVVAGIVIVRALMLVDGERKRS